LGKADFFGNKERFVEAASSGTRVGYASAERVLRKQSRGGELESFAVLPSIT
jgi:hypothetical protein